MSSRKKSPSSLRSLRLSISRPRSSKIRMSAERGSTGDVCTCTAEMWLWRAQYRHTGAGSTERSMTLVPDEIIPDMSARPIMRADRV